MVTATDVASATASVEPGPRVRFLALLADSLHAGTFIALVLAAPRAKGGEPERIRVRRTTIRGADTLSFVRQYPTQDVTENHSIEAGLTAIGTWLDATFSAAHLFTATADVQMDTRRRGAAALRRCRPTRRAGESPSHDRAKRRHVDPARPFLQALGVTDSRHRVLPSMQHKWKQIDKFVEIVAGALAASPLAGRPRVRIADFGAGKGYLTFAVHDYLTFSLGIEADVAGVELRDDLVAFCNRTAADLGLRGLRFVTGGLDGGCEPGELDVMIALHACDTATDLAIQRGIAAGAAIILCAPCCHKQLRPQLRPPAVLQPVLRFGAHADREAAMVTDSLRALLLESRGYATKVFEFVSPEHTGRNMMILAIRRAAPEPAAEAEALARAAGLMAFYGIRDLALEALLRCLPPAAAVRT